LGEAGTAVSPNLFFFAPESACLGGRCLIYQGCICRGSRV